jgi:hypothetical protein
VATQKAPCGHEIEVGVVSPAALSAQPGVAEAGAVLVTTLPTLSIAAHSDVDGQLIALKECPASGVLTAAVHVGAGSDANACAATIAATRSAAAIMPAAIAARPVRRPRPNLILPMVICSQSWNLARVLL